MTLRVQEILTQKGKSRYWLFQQLNMSYQSFRRMLDNETKSISKENIEALCLILSCTPNDLFSIGEDAKGEE